MQEQFRLVTVASPSGTGKSTLCRRLLTEFKHLRFSVSTTTRDMRRNEVDGVDYHFVDPATFLKMIDAGDFVEWEEVHGKHYGTTHSEIKAARAEGKSLLLDLDYRGALQIKKAYPETIAVFLLPPSIAELERRIRGRGENTEAQIRLRLSNAAEELTHYQKFDYVVINDSLDRAYDELRSIYISGACRTTQRAAVAERLIREATLSPVET